MVEDKQSVPIRGVYAALATPQRPDSTEVDAAALLDYLDTVVRAGVDGLVLFGSTGEFIHFDLEERMKVLSLAIRRTRVPLLVNVSHSTLAGALALAHNAIDSDTGGILLMPPYFYRYSDDQIFRFFESFVDTIAGKIRVYLYNLPFFTNPLSPGLAARLLTTGWFAGIKDSSGEWSLFEKLLDLRAKHSFTLLVGNESVYLRGRAAGADGIVSGIAAAVPELIVALDRAVDAKDRPRADRLDARLHQLVEWTQKFPATIGIKQTAVSRGWKIERNAFPLDEHTAATLKEFQEFLASWIPAVLAECGDSAPASA